MQNAIAQGMTPVALEPPDHASEALGFISGLVAGAQPVTWIFSGDSITHGALYTEGWRSFPEHFAERVRWELRRASDVVINTGVFGQRSAGLLTELEVRALRFLPDVVLVMIGMNDAVLGPAGRSAFRDNLLEIVGRIREAGAIPVVQTPNTVYRPNSLFWVDLPAYVDIIRDVAHETQSPLVDHWRHWERAKPDPVRLLDWLQDQSIHPNGYGHRELARHLCRALRLYDPASLVCRLEVP